MARERFGAPVCTCTQRPLATPHTLCASGARSTSCPNTVRMRSSAMGAVVCTREQRYALACSHLPRAQSTSHSRAARRPSHPNTAQMRPL
ncbi:hypothetical protein K438DRAFT_1875756 [Mycena galopus ATCC 62051]|nr:hypothetical protein K438DRAFT_1875756 [Mycena galopus ATCC 62051]